VKEENIFQAVKTKTFAPLIDKLILVH